jgi:hypothetical protein
MPAESSRVRLFVYVAETLVAAFSCFIVGAQLWSKFFPKDWLPQHFDLLTTITAGSLTAVAGFLGVRAYIVSQKVVMAAREIHENAARLMRAIETERTGDLETLKKDIDALEAALQQRKALIRELENSKSKGINEIR